MRGAVIFDAPHLQMSRPSPGLKQSNGGASASASRAAVAGVALAECVGIVVIGRNEGVRLERCLASLPRWARHVIYVDSASSDASVEMVRARGLDVVELDAAVPLSAARARNEGFSRIVESSRMVDKVQFVDGDSEIEPGWLERAAAELDAHPDVAAVHGRIRESAPERSIYNRLCEIEWNQAPSGERASFGGNVMIRAADLSSAGLWNADVIAAEDDELCLRLRRLGRRVVKIDAPMLIHDAAILHARQWWKRAVRCGHAYAQVTDLHGESRERYFLEERRRAYVWGAAIPGAAIALFLPTLGLSLGLFAAYPLRAARIAYRTWQDGVAAGDAAAWGISCVASSFPQMAGILRYRINRARGRRGEIIEHKEA